MTTPPAPSEQALTALLADWLPRQRWFAGKGRPLAAVHPGPRTPVALAPGAGVVHLVVGLRYTDGGEDLYQVPLSLRSEPLGRLEPALVGVCEGVAVYDAPHDEAAAGAWLELLRTGGRQAGLSFTANPTGPAWPQAGGADSLVIGAEQSNTSVVYGAELIFKLFRRLWPGVNPDLEVTRALHEVGCEYVVPPLAWVSGVAGGVETTFGLLQPFYPSATEGWRLATASVRDLYAEADLHADEVGGDFAAESARLGAATGEVHRALAAALPCARVGPAYARESARRMRQRLDEAVEVVPALAVHQDGVRAAFDALEDLAGPFALQRTHGDLHLGQVLRVEAGWRLFDFEGEPARPLAERTALESPLRDVAGMLRSFDYAARSLLVDLPGRDELAYRAGEWAERNREAFCQGYASATGQDPREEEVLLRAFELEKAVYEVVYEARHRPSWLPIPLGCIERLVG